MIFQYKRKWAYVSNSLSIENKKHTPNLQAVEEHWQSKDKKHMDYYI